MRAIAESPRPSDGHLVRVVGLQGFGSRSSGEAVYVDGDGMVTAGTLLAGTADAAIADAAAQGMVGAFTAHVADPDAEAGGLACGGTAQLLITPATSMPRAALDAIAADTPVVVMTSLYDGATAVIVDGAEPLGAADLFPLLRDAAPALLRANRDTSEVEHGTLIESFVGSTSVRIVGHAAVGDALARQAALLGWSAVIVDGVDDAVAAAEAQRSSDALVVLSHDAEIDTAALHAALGHGRGYVGALGSRGTQAARRTRLAALGHGAEAIGTIHGPVGLDLGSKSPAETAVAIAAEIIAFKSGRSAASLHSHDGPING